MNVDRKICRFQDLQTGENNDIELDRGEKGDRQAHNVEEQMSKCRETTLSHSLNAWADSFHSMFTILIEDKYLRCLFDKVPQDCEAFRLIFAARGKTQVL